MAKKYAKIRFGIALREYIVRQKQMPILEEIKNGKYHNSYFLSGSNEYASANIVQALKKAVLIVGFESFDLEQFDAMESSFDMGELKRAFFTPPMASTKRLTVLSNVDMLTDTQRKDLLSMLASPPETGILIMVSNPEKKTKAGFYQKLRSLARSEELRKPKRAPLVNWIQAFVKRYGCTVDQDALQIIVEYVGEDQISLSGELEKMVTYVGKNRKITYEDARAVLTSNMMNTVFDLTDAVGNRQRKSALSVLTYLLEWGEAPEKILGVLRGFFIRLRGFVFYKQRGILRKDIAQKMGVMFFIVNKEMEYIRNFSETEIKKRLEFLYDAEVRIKTGEEPEFILTNLVYNLI
jgi:DNA polymerase-3 subunit delta